MKKSFLTTLLCASTTLAALGQQTEPKADSTKNNNIWDIYWGTRAGMTASADAKLGKVNGRAFVGLQMELLKSSTLGFGGFIAGFATQTPAPTLGENTFIDTRLMGGIGIVNHALSGQATIGLSQALKNNDAVSIYAEAGYYFSKNGGDIVAHPLVNAGVKFNLLRGIQNANKKANPTP